MRRAISLAVFQFCLATVSAQAQTDPPIADVPNPSDQAYEVLAFWSQIVPGSDDERKPQVEARFVVMSAPDYDPAGETDPGAVSKASCRAVSVAGARSGAAIETRGSLVGRYREGSPDAYTRGKHYLVAVCAVALDAAADAVSLSRVSAPGAVLPVYPEGKPAQIAGPGRLGRRNGAGLEAVFLADSGCRSMDGQPGTRFWQDCSDDGVSEDGVRGDGRGIWPLRPMAESAAAMTPDFMIHGGDHHYFQEDNAFWTRETDKTDRFEYWLQEILIPAQPLLLAAPFVFVRGNHESCEITVNAAGAKARKWFGDGWFKMFAPPGVVGCVDHSPTWHFDIAPVDNTAVPPFRFHVVDTSQPGAAFGAFDAAATDPRADKAWLSHYPAVKLVYYEPAAGAANTPHVGDASVLSSISASVTTCETGKGVHCLPRFMLAGHQHLYQQVDLFGDKGAFLTRMVVAGNGGTVLDYANLPQIAIATLPEVMVECSYSFPGDRPFGQTVVRAEITNVSRHGFLHLTRDTGAEHGLGWRMAPIWFPMTAAPPVDKVPSAEGKCAP